jgi:hypothetical protein
VEGGTLSERERSDEHLAELTAPAVRYYVVRVCGPHAPSKVVERALARIAGAKGRPPTNSTPTERVRDAAREAALAEAARRPRLIGTRLRHVGRGCLSSTRVPELLRRRAAGAITERDLARLDGALARCPACRKLAAGVEAAEYDLKVALAKLLVEPVGKDAHPAPRPRRTPPIVTTPAPGLKPTPAARSEPRFAPPPARSRRRLGLVAIGVLATVLCAGVLIETLGSGGRQAEFSASSSRSPATLPRSSDALVVPVLGRNTPGSTYAPPASTLRRPVKLTATPSSTAAPIPLTPPESTPRASILR